VTVRKMLLLSTVFVGALVAAACVRRAPSAPSAPPVAPGAHRTAGAEPDRGPKRIQELKRTIEVLRPLAEELGPPQPGDWLEQHKEPGQTFQEYLASDPPVPTEARRIIYIQPLGTFTAGQRRVVTSTAEFMGLFYDLPVAMRDDLPLSVIPARARRFRWGYDQVLSTYVLDEVLRPRLPADAASCIAFTASDLWAGEGWNFVFGQASLSRPRGGVGEGGSATPTPPRRPFGSACSARRRRGFTSWGTWSASPTASPTGAS
jgi:hypothetical protein